MSTRRGRAAVLAAVCSALWSMPTPAAAQHEQHGVPAGGAQVVLTGTAHCAEGTPLSGAIVQLFHGSGPGRHLMATSVTDPTGRFAVRAGGGTYTLEISYPGDEPHRQRVTLATAPRNVGSVRLECRPIELDAVIASAERVAVELRSERPWWTRARPPQWAAASQTSFAPCLASSSMRTGASACAAPVCSC